MACSIDIIAVDRISYIYVQASSFKQASILVYLYTSMPVYSTNWMGSAEGKSDKWCRRSNYDDVIYENQTSLDLNCEKTRWEYSRKYLRGNTWEEVCPQKSSSSKHKIPPNVKCLLPELRGRVGKEPDAIQTSPVRTFLVTRINIARIANAVTITLYSKVTM